MWPPFIQYRGRRQDPEGPSGRDKKVEAETGSRLMGPPGPQLPTALPGPANTRKEVGAAAVLAAVHKEWIHRIMECRSLLPPKNRVLQAFPGPRTHICTATRVFGDGARHLGLPVTCFRCPPPPQQRNRLSGSDCHGHRSTEPVCAYHQLSLAQQRARCWEAQISQRPASWTRAMFPAGALRKERYPSRAR